MKRTLHYLKCAFNIAKNGILKAPGIIKKAFSRCFRVIGCLFLINKKSERRVPENALSVYYPDKGDLCGNAFYESAEPEYDLSVIIPVYNGEAYIGECIESVIRQETGYSYEIIIVDDGSTDGTGEILAEYAKAENIKVFRRQNRGQSAARNFAIGKASGRFIMFADGDDLLLPNAIQKLIRAAEDNESDIAEGCVVKFYKDITEDMLKDSAGKDAVYSYKTNKSFALPCVGYSIAKVYKRELWNTLRFPEGYIFEDIITKFILRRKAGRVAFIKDVVYGYRQNNQSSSHGKASLKHLDSIWVLPRIFEICDRENAPRDDIFYLLSLNHIGVLNRVTTRAHTENIRIACFAEMRKQLLLIQDCKPEKMPLMFKLLDRSIIEEKFEAWEYIADTIQKYGMLKKWREIN